MTILCAAAFCFAGAAPAQQKNRILVEKAADLPRFTYKVDGKLDDIVLDNAKFAAFAREYRRDVDATLAQYDIADKSTSRQLLNSLAQLDWLDGRNAEAKGRLEQVRALQEKPADKLLSGLLLGTFISAQQQVGNRDSPQYAQEVGRRLGSTLAGMPFEVVQNEVRELKASSEIMSEALVLGYVREVLQPAVTRSGSISSDLAPALISARYRTTAVLPLKPVLVATVSDYLARNTVQKNDIWAARDVELAAGAGYSPVTVAIWDSGSDTSLFRDRLAKGAGDAPAVIAYDKYSNPSTGELLTLPDAMKSQLRTMMNRAKGFSDLQSNIDSPEASEIKQYLSALKPTEYKAAIEQLRAGGNYLHGTHVAGIALAGNPYARLVVGRIEFGHTLIPDPCPSKELSERSARAAMAYVAFFRRNNVRVVNMSWGGSIKGEENELELCGIGVNADERKRLAREYFDIERDGLAKAFASAPEILFVASAGNDNADASFTEFIPSGIVLPNLLTVGAVDLAGDEASFTSYGPTVKVHANGYQVDSVVPGGQRIAESGTSMSSPQVTNLVAKMLAVSPSLTPPQLIDIIVKTADRTPDGRRVLVNPKKALAATAAAPKPS
ncbi:MAG: S8 family serine peptidase [Betaproteobacteria bacterium]